MTRRQEAPVLPAKYLISNRTVEPHPAVHWMANPDPDPALKNVLKITYKEFSAVEKDKKIDQNYKKNHGPEPNLLTITTNFL